MKVGRIQGILILFGFSSSFLFRLNLQCSLQTKIFICDPRSTKVYYISLNSQKKELSELMSYMKIVKEKAK